ncbi:unnamed protein product [Mytilus edulis]|uniref:COR domain-containing protein n=1 Tax=Mytilus edulis TaxID=6550 RepID=A0A8S3RDI7_MYTED|nr:unnamed protein product [Mytilus edulis]
MKYMETSAKTGENVVEVFVSLAEDLIYREKNKESQSSDEDEKATRLSRLPQLSHEKVDEELGLLGLETTEDLQEIMKLGTYRSYGNRIFLVGQFSVGKTTLSKVLIGEGLPKQRGATDGIGIHIGKAGMSLDDKKWLSFHTGSTNLDIVAGMLMSLQKQNSEGMHHGEQCLYSVESIKEVEKVIEERHAKSSVLPKTVKPTSYDNPNIQLQFRNLLSSNIPQWKLKNLIFQAIKEGKYKQNLVFFDIWDFAGQKEFYMTHQLFMTSRGIFVLMFNACHSLRLENDSSIASHQEPSAAGLAHLEYKPLIFINATDINDREIDLLRQCLIERASDHPRWGEEMPTAWIPLELQIAEQVELGNHIISKQQLEDLNSNNQSMVLSEKQINTFLKVQHSLGKLLYFDEVNLRDYIIINPVFLVEVLRSIITDKQFWPKEEKLLKIFRCLDETGTLERNDMYALWNQKEFIHIVPYREFMTDILVYLDILVAQHNPSEDGNHTPIGACNFFVPCMIKSLITQNI